MNFLNCTKSIHRSLFPHRHRQKLVHIIKYQFVRLFSSKMEGLDLGDVVECLERFAPTKYAGSWDNVGLLIEPYTEKKIKTIFLTNDLIEAVLHEAISKNADLIISYHPPIFTSLKRITQKSWKQRILTICLENKIAVYSPHTAWDFIRGGVNDWLSKAIPFTSSVPIVKPYAEIDGGIGRLLHYPPMALREVVERVKNHIGTRVQVAIAANKTLEDKIKNVAVCAGSGASVLAGIQADLYLTGEMSHHEILDATENGVSVILCNHSNSERGFLKTFQRKLEDDLQEECSVIISEIDRDPLITF